MSYVECPKCGHKALSVATQCPHCGLDFLTQPAKPIVEPETRELRPILLMGGGVLLALVLVVTLVVVLWPDAESGMSPQPTATATKQSAPAADTARTPAATPPDAPPTVTPQTQRYARRWVNVRKARRPDAAILRVLKPGEAVQADSLKAGWYRVSIGGQPVGYVYRAYLSLVAPGTVRQ